MNMMTVGELKTHFSQVLDHVQTGEKVQILYGRAKKPVAQIIPITEELPERPIGLHEGKMKFHIAEDFKFRTTEEFLGLT